jgi:hypothetical protein
LSGFACKLDNHMPSCIASSFTVRGDMMPQRLNAYLAVLIATQKCSMGAEGGEPLVRLGKKTGRERLSYWASVSFECCSRPASCTSVRQPASLTAKRECHHLFPFSIPWGFSVSFPSEKITKVKGSYNANQAIKFHVLCSLSPHSTKLGYCKLRDHQ